MVVRGEDLLKSDATPFLRRMGLPIVVVPARQDIAILLDQVTPGGEDWQESQLPRELRMEFVRGWRARRLESTAFELRLVPQGLGVRTHCLGRIERATDGPRVFANVLVSPSSKWIGFVAATVLGVGLAAESVRYFGMRESIQAGMIAAVGFLGIWAIDATIRVYRHRSVYRAVLERSFVASSSESSNRSSRAV